MARKGFKALKVQVNKKGYGRCQGRELRTASKLSRGNFATLSVTTVRQKSCSAASAMAVAAVVN